MKPIDLTKIPDDALRSEWARRNSHKRKVHAGGRPKSLDRCECGAMTLARAAQRGHKCQLVNVDSNNS